MPIHDWTRVDAGIFHAFHQQWVIAISNALNAGLLPASYYCLPEQVGAGFEPDVLTLHSNFADDDASSSGRDPAAAGNSAVLVSAPTIAPTAASDLDIYRRKQTAVVVRHVSDDRIIAVIEIVSRGNKSSVHAVRSFIERALDFLDKQVHLLIVDLFPPGRRDPQGLHAILWDEIAGQDYALPAKQPFVVSSYEAATGCVRTYVHTLGLGSVIPDMPLFLKLNGYIQVPLETTYETSYTVMPVRWRRVLDSAEPTVQ